MILFVTILCLLLIDISTSEYCIQNKDKDCTFECHCARDDECRLGTCPSGCAKAALGYDWSGPACQIGNVGLHKNARMTVVDISYKNKYPAKAAFDGENLERATTSACAHLINTPNKPAEWWADLGAVYRIYNITIYGRTDCCQKRLQQFDLTVYNTSKSEELCAHRKNTIWNHATITCRKSMTGRYVHFKRTGGNEIHLTVLCEVIITGHKVYDCSNCPVSASCDEVTGCQSCEGSYQPECKPECRNGSYGLNCNQKCGNCKTSNNCHKRDGHCLDGCQQWWADDTCKTPIGNPEYRNETITLLSESSYSVEIKWQTLKSLSANLSQFYGYLIGYKEGNATDYTEVESRKHKPSISEFVARVTNLTFDTLYDIRVTTYRETNGQRELGPSYPTLRAKTRCTEPTKPILRNVSVSYSKAWHIPNINVNYQSVAELIANCREITNITLNIRRTDDEQYSQVFLSLTNNSYTVIPDAEGQYELWITVTNNEGYSSDSERHMMNVAVTVPGQTSNHTAIYASVSVVLILAIATVVVVVVVVVVIKKRRKAPEAGQQYVNAAFVRDLNIGSGKKEQGRKRDTLFPDPDTESCDDKLEEQTPVSEDSFSVASVSEIQMEAVEAISDGREDCIYANSAVNVVNLEGYFMRKMADMKTLENEYETLPEADFSRCLIAVTDDNKTKNRFHNIYPYDDTRVPLEDSDNTSNGYINASYITGYNKQKEYIATQGPKRNTLADFWRMVWQENSNRIVMLANVSEMGKKKVEPYWCESVGGTCLFGDFTVKTIDFEKSADYDTRIMSVEKGNQHRTVRQFHFKTWEDKGKPRYGAHTLLAFMDRVHSFGKNSQGPLVVHCSAAVGRTGTFIALDILRHMAVEESSVDICACVEKLRQERMLAVQTKDQYIFLHEAMVEFIKYRNTSHDCSRFIHKFASVCEPQLDNQVTSVLRNELKHLHQPKKVTTNKCKSGLSEENRSKNRNLQLVPDDCERLFVSVKSGNYINAVSVDSYAAHDSKIVTQMPLPHTIDDFWKLVMEQNCRAVIMLNSLEQSDPTCIPYWPEDINKKKTYGQTEVELLTVDGDIKSDIIVKRDLRITEVKQMTLSPPHVMVIRHFQLTSWPNSEILPPQRKHILVLMDQLQSWQQQEKIPSDQWKILVHCIDGGSRSGMFCGVSFLLDRLKAEQDVNAYLAARSVRRYRPQVFSSIVEYQFLYQMAVERLTESNEYVNY